MAGSRKSRRNKGGCRWGCIVSVAAVWLLLMVMIVVHLNLQYAPAAPTAELSDHAGQLPTEGASAPRRDLRPLPLLARGRGRGASSEAVAASEGQASGAAQPAAASARVDRAAKYENNAPWPGLREGDSDIASPVTEVLPGAGPDHLHGDLHALPNWQPTPLPSGGLDAKAHREAHKGQCYNARKSDSLPLDRDQPDKRSKGCRKLHAGYYEKGALPVASVVIVFHNEIASALVRSVHSVLNHSPPELLKEVFLVDDASKPDPLRFDTLRWDNLQAPLETYIKELPKVHLVRLKQRRGLMLARMEGCWRATSDVVVFLDSHIEATVGWMEPLLARIRDDDRHVVVPSIDGINFDKFSYEGGSGLGVLGFSWTLGQKPQPTSGDGMEPLKSPIMAGGLFAADRAFFLYQGGYDPEMRFYGGEEMEIGFRVWQCGGMIEYIPCSHVFHIFRDSTFWQNTDSAGVAYKVPGMEITRNKLRAAAVWMDEYEKLVQYASAPLPEGTTLGDLEPRKELRRKLQCKSFKWYLENVAKNMFVPDIDSLKGGAIRNPELKACVDTMGSDQPGLYPCHNQHGSQGFVIDGEGLIRSPLKMYEQCLGAKKGKLKLQSCPSGKFWDTDATKLRWKLDKETGTFSLGDKCLEAVREGKRNGSPVDVQVTACEDPPGELQQWVWDVW